jgi:hypothetical protein
LLAANKNDIWSESMDLRKLKKLIDLVEESSITELEINDAEERVRIVKHFAAAAWRSMLTRRRTALPLAPPVAGPTSRLPSGGNRSSGRRHHQGADGRHLLSCIESRC